MFKNWFKEKKLVREREERRNKVQALIKEMNKNSYYDSYIPEWIINRFIEEKNEFLIINIVIDESLFLKINAINPEIIISYEKDDSSYYIKSKKSLINTYFIQTQEVFKQKDHFVEMINLLAPDSFHSFIETYESSINAVLGTIATASSTHPLPEKELLQAVSGLQMLIEIAKEESVSNEYRVNMMYELDFLKMQTASDLDLLIEMRKGGSHES